MPSFGYFRLNAMTSMQTSCNQVLLLFSIHCAPHFPETRFHCSYCCRLANFIPLSVSFKMEKWKRNMRRRRENQIKRKNIWIFTVSAHFQGIQFSYVIWWVQQIAHFAFFFFSVQGFAKMEQEQRQQNRSDANWNVCCRTLTCSSYHFIYFSSFFGFAHWQNFIIWSFVCSNFQWKVMRSANANAWMRYEQPQLINKRPNERSIW